jgi:CSLREA domain-containing protein
MLSGELHVSAAPIRRRAILAPIAIVGALVLTLVYAAAAGAATFTVNSTSDTALPVSSSTSCPATCTLREAVQAADNTGGANTITLPAGDYKLTIASTGADDPSTGDLDVKNNDSLTVNGAGASTTTIDANSIDRAFAVDSGSSLTLSGVTITHGKPSTLSTGGVAGGDIYSNGTLSVSNSVFENTAAPGDGAAIYNNAGSLTLTGDTFTDITGPVDGTIFVNAGAASLNGDTFTDDVLDFGSGVYVGGGSLTDTGSTFDRLAAYDDGGAIYVAGSATSAAFTNTVFTDDNSGEGGAICDLSGSLSLTGTTFSNDYASAVSPGGAINYDAPGGSLTVTSSTFNGDSAGGSTTSDNPDGGAIDDQQGTGSITSSRFTNDTAANDGGAIDFLGTSLTVSQSTFADDSGPFGGSIYSSAGTGLTVSQSSFAHDNAEFGGGIDVSSGALSVTRSSLVHESAAFEEGGGLYLNTTGTVTVANTTLSDDRAGNGGGVYISSGAPSFINDTFADNQARASDGGGIYGPASATTIQNTIIADNAGGDCNTLAGAADKGNNLDSDGTCFSTGTGDKIAVDPLLGPLQDNGGPGPTLDLLTGSPAIGAGSNVACNASPVSGFDERGVARPQGTFCDIGAVETATADVAITNTAPSSAVQGTPMTYTLSVTDNGVGPAGNVVVTDTLPSSATYFGSTTSQGSCSGTTTVTCSLGSVAKGSTAKITITVIPTATGSLSDTASASTAQTDPNTANNSATATTTITPTTTTTTVTVTKTVNVAPVVLTGTASHIKSTSATLSAVVNPAGETTTYNFVVTTGNVTTSVPGGALAASSNPTVVSVPVKHLKAGKTYHFQIEAVNATGASFGQALKFKTAKSHPKPKKRKKHHRA